MRKMLAVFALALLPSLGWTQSIWVGVGEEHTIEIEGYPYTYTIPMVEVTPGNDTAGPGVVEWGIDTWKVVNGTIVPKTQKEIDEQARRAFGELMTKQETHRPQHIPMPANTGMADLYHDGNVNTLDDQYIPLQIKVKPFVLRILLLDEFGLIVDDVDFALDTPAIINPEYVQGLPPGVLVRDWAAGADLVFDLNNVNNILSVPNPVIPAPTTPLIDIDSPDSNNDGLNDNIPLVFPEDATTNWTPQQVIDYLRSQGWTCLGTTTCYPNRHPDFFNGS